MSVTHREFQKYWQNQCQNSRPSRGFPTSPLHKHITVLSCYSSSAHSKYAHEIINTQLPGQPLDPLHCKIDILSTLQTWQVCHRRVDSQEPTHPRPLRHFERALIISQTSRMSPVRFLHEPTLCDLSNLNAEQFVEFYYKTFDQDRQQLASLYVRHPRRAKREREDITNRNTEGSLHAHIRGCPLSRHSSGNREAQGKVDQT